MVVVMKYHRHQDHLKLNLMIGLIKRIMIKGKTFKEYLRRLDQQVISSNRISQPMSRSYHKWKIISNYNNTCIILYLSTIILIFVIMKRWCEQIKST